MKYVVFERKDVSYDFTDYGRGKARRLALRVEVPKWPVSRRELTQLGKRLVERERGKGWQAISIALLHDRREIIPALGILEWAPGGNWEDAQYGNGRTWDGYAMEVNLRDKVAHPADCTVPTEEAYVYEDEFNEAIEAGAEDEDQVIADIARRHAKSSEHVYDLILTVESWTIC